MSGVAVLTVLRRARFASSVRVLKDLKKKEDLKYLLGQLPPWITSPEWENGKPFQVLLSLLWPALNSTICLALKNLVEDRMQESVDYGHIKFSRFSLGRNPPVICGVKAVPLHEEDLLALVIDVDLRWAGEPDVMLSLSKLSRATLGLKNLQISAMVRLVLSPIIEDPPFLQRMTVSLLNTPLIDFNLRVLGGPDVMSLPAISSWLHAAILNVTDRFLVWPREISVPLVPALREERKPLPQGVPPLGVIVIRIEEAELQKRRSTFLGRWKLPNPRLAVISPKENENGVPQLTLTSVKEKTLTPTWMHSKAFVVTHPDQAFRILLSHRRVESFFGADMPLGSAEIDLIELFNSCQDEGMSNRSFVTSMSRKSSAKTTDEGYETACSSPILSSPIKQVSFASPSGHLMTDSKAVAPSILDIIGDDGSDDPFESRIFAPENLLKDGEATKRVAWTPPTQLVPWQVEDNSHDSVAGTLKDLKSKSFDISSFGIMTGSAWIDVISSPVMTMSGLVSGALAPKAAPPLTPFESTNVDGSAGAWFGSFQNFFMRSAFGQTEYASDHESTEGDIGPVNLERDVALQPAHAARVRISYRWIPINYDSLPEDNKNEENLGARAEGVGESFNMIPSPYNTSNKSPVTPPMCSPPTGKTLRTLPSDSGVLTIRVAFTKIDYGDCPSNPVLCFGLVPSTMEVPARISSAVQGSNLLFSVSDKASHRILSMDYHSGSRPGVLHWGQTFHLPVWKASDSRVKVELGNASSSFKLSSYGSDLFLLDASGSAFHDDVAVEASAYIPLKDVMSKGAVEGNYRLREAKTERMAGVNDSQRLDIGRIVLGMSWFPFSLPL